MTTEARGLMARILAVAGRCGPIAHDKENEYSKYTYATLAQIRSEVVPAMVAEGVSLMLLTTTAVDGTLEMLFRVANVEVEEDHLDFHRTKPILSSKSPLDKLLAGLITSAWREIYSDLFHLRMGVEDGDHQDHERGSHKQKGKQKNQQNQQNQQKAQRKGDNWSATRAQRDRDKQAMEDRLDRERQEGKKARAEWHVKAKKQFVALAHANPTLAKEYPVSPDWTTERYQSFCVWSQDEIHKATAAIESQEQAEAVDAFA